METKGLDGEIGFWTYIDAFSHRLVVVLKKPGVHQDDKFKGIVANFENQSRNRVKWVKFDNHGEYQSKKMLEFVQQKGIEMVPSNPYDPRQNGVAERMNRTLVEMAKSMLKGANMGKEYWPFAIMCAVYVTNRIPTKANVDGKTAVEKWTGQKPKYEWMRKFGSRCYITRCNKMHPIFFK
jgi:transposase InsO family protein